MSLRVAEKALYMLFLGDPPFSKKFLNETWTSLRTNLSLFKYLSATCTCELFFSITIFQSTKGYWVSSDVINK